MAEVSALTAARMLEIEAQSIVDGDVVGDNLILTQRDGDTINAGNVRGPQGPAGTPGSNTPYGNMVGYLEAQILSSQFPSIPTGSAPGAILVNGWDTTGLTGFTNPSAGRWVPQQNGLYWVYMKVTFAGNTGVNWPMGAQLWNGGSQLGNAGNIVLHSGDIGNSHGVDVVFPYRFTTAMSLGMSIWQGSGAAKTPNSVWLRIIYAGP